MIEQLILALVPSLIELVKNAAGDTYDKDIELRIMLKLQRELTDARERALITPRMG